MSAIPINQHTSKGRVLVADGVVYVRELEEHDDEVARIVGEADDPVAAASSCLRIGARALRAAHVSVDVDVIERSFAELEHRFETRVNTAVDEIARSTAELLDEDDGALTGTLGTFRGELVGLLGDTFDADSKTSVLAKIEDLVLGTMKGLITPEIDDSPIGRLRKELVDTVQREVSDVAEEVRRVTEHLGIVDATDEVYEQTTGKGFDFEDLVDECVSTLAVAHGDLAESTGLTQGATGSKVGDEVVTLNRDDTLGCEASFVIEVKNRKLNLRATLAELDEAIANRDAYAAVAVFRSQEQAPTSVPFMYTDDKAIVVLDPDDEDDAALRLGYMWARWTVRKQLASSEEQDGIDVERVRCLLEDASRALERHATIKRAHTVARKGIDQAGEQVQLLVAESRTALDDLALELQG
ncbi:MAG: hypothetical protein ABW211_06605 [Acidimicrobiia bacterium]